MQPSHLGVMAGVAALLAAPVAALGSSGGVAGASPLAVPGGRPTVVRGAADQGPVPGNRPVQVTLALPLRDRAGLAALNRSLYDPASPNYHRFLTPGQFEARFSPRPAQVATVTGWARAAGLRVVSVSANRTLVRVQGAAASLDRAFGVSLHRFHGPMGTDYRSPTTPATLPPSVAGEVSSVVGLSTLGRVSVAPPASQSAGPALPTSYGPRAFWQAYDAPPSAQGAGQTIAILAEGKLGQVRTDLRTFEQTFGLPTVPVTTVQVGAPSNDTSGQTEWDLDTQYSTGFAPQVSRLMVYDAHSLSNADILAEFNRYVTDDAAKEASFSAGECELLAKASGFLGPADAALAQGVAQGQTLFTASGDTGSFCPALVGANGVPIGIPGPNYPASSPDAVGVGGTTLLGGSGPLAEIAWYGSGGGISALEPEPTYQAAVGGANTGIHRGVPDVALDADPNTGYKVVVAGKEEVVGGTSASSPSWLGIWARAQGAHHGCLGFADPTIYAEPASSFRDITVGGNGLYPATPGYDYVTGRGSPDIAAFVAQA
ncbi:MAG TPA: S53 family peptidase [Acidimicrobiales bacterium]|nr:S53 family peptidase [Acidimicrobiales bacterium]